MTEIVNKYQPMPNTREMCDYLIDTLGVSPDIVTIEPAATITGTLAALSEKGRMIATETTTKIIRQRYDELSPLNLLPLHLQSVEAYEARYRQLWV